MSYVKGIGKIRDILEKEVKGMLSRISITSSVFPLHIQHRDTEMSYAVEQKGKKEPHLILIDSTTEDPVCEVSVDCIDLEELAQIADALEEMEANKSA